MIDLSAQVRAALERTRLTSNWPEEAIAEVCAQSEIRFYKDGERACSSGDSVDAVWVITDGCFLLSKTWHNGRRFLYSFSRPGQTSGILPVFDGMPAPFDVSARDHATAIVIPGAAVRSVAARHPQVGLEVIALLCRRTRADLETIELHAMNSVRCRIAKMILWIARGQSAIESDEIVVDSKISQEDLADTVCAARQSVNRELRRLMQEGILKQRYRTLVILDREALIRVAAEDEALSPVAQSRLAPAPPHFYPTTE
ncbi:MAG TPA: Crp/Fnr family transcriptional regulator [Rhizomicrobium sp.]|nr:Crp/Fnr family transcriptional regulator [Rhizomicrobium sp.]